MGKIIKLTESDLTRIVRRVINEQSTNTAQPPSKIDSKVKQISSEFVKLSQQFNSNANQLKGPKGGEVGEQSSTSVSCDSIKLGVNLYVAMIATRLGKAVEYNIPILAASSINERVGLQNKQMEEMVQVLEYLKKIQEYVKP